jgi:hypothetical protein
MGGQLGVATMATSKRRHRTDPLAGQTERRGSRPS